ncbi:GGDEF domain-containing protein [Cupriavidus sp. USMAA2-4]|uniref:GGDEF domain-containing protein n=1 Tax=Cupriavidus sp. USMAA2-4 TaxID=876364 RepID=UPI000AD27FDC|nr:GGDEF domain-containing protein [Cupriavidus sp. USMAA2-4]
MGNPAIATLLSLCFLLAWSYERAQRHLLMFCASFLIYALAASAQILQLPRDAGVNLLLSCALYLGSTLLLLRGVVARADAQFDAVPLTTLACLQLIALAYFHYADDQIAARIYILHGGIAVMLLTGVARLGKLRLGAAVDRALYWILLAFALSFVPRSALTITSAASGNADSLAHSPFWIALQLSLVLFGIVLGLALLAGAMSDVIDKLREERDTDPLTRLHNRRSFEVLAEREIPPRQDQPLSVLLCDIDHFKHINDTHGHVAGDTVLSEFGHLVLASIRHRDIAGRIGGEEFAILLPGTDVASALHLAERLRHTLETTAFEALPGTCTVTASFGVTALAAGESLDDLLTRADMLLYTAKREGRNCVAFEHNPPPAQLANSRQAA